MIWYTVFVLAAPFQVVLLRFSLSSYRLINMDSSNGISQSAANRASLLASVRRKAEKDSSGPKSKHPKRERYSKVQFSDLPGDVLIKIVKYLEKAQWPSLERIDRKMQEAVHQVWKLEKKFRIDEDFVLKESEPDTASLKGLLEKLLLRAPHTMEIVGFTMERGATEEDREEIFQLFARFQNLESISFSKCSISNEELRRFLRESASRGTMKAIDVSGAGGRMFGDQPIDTDDDPIMQLETLWCDDVENARSLRIADVSRLTRLSLANSRLYVGPLAELVERAENLEYLAFGVSRNCARREIEEIFRVAGTKNLRNLKITGANNGAFEALIRLIEALGRRGQLRGFGLPDWNCKLEFVIDSISSYMTNLRKLEISVINCQAPPLVRLAQRLTKLEKLEFLGHCAFDLPSGVIAAIGTNLGELQSLQLRCDFISNAGLASLDQLTKLKKFHIWYGNVNDAILETWADGFGSNLEEFIVGGCLRNASWSGLLKLICKASRLRYLYLDFPKINNDHLKAIASSCPLLRKVHLDFAKKSMPAGIQAAIEQFHAMKWFSTPEIDGGHFDLKTVKLAKYRKLNYDWTNCRPPFGGEAV